MEKIIWKTHWKNSMLIHENKIKQNKTTRNRKEVH